MSGPVVVAHVLPPPGHVDLASARDVTLDELEVHPGEVLHHLLDPVAVGHQGDGQVLEAHPIPEPAVERAAMEEDGHAGGVGRCDGALDVAHPTGLAGVELFVPQPRPVVPGLDRELEELGHRGVIVEHLGQRPVLGLDDAPFALARDRPLLELGEQAPADGDLRHDLQPFETEVPLDVPVRPARGRQTLVVPDGDRLVPVAEFHVGDAVRLLPAEDLVEPFSDRQRMSTYSAEERGSGRG